MSMSMPGGRVHVRAHVHFYVRCHFNADYHFYVRVHAFLLIYAAICYSKTKIPRNTVGIAATHCSLPTRPDKADFIVAKMMLEPVLCFL
jgi:hypothetical protein